MRELLKSMLRFSWAGVLLGIREGISSLLPGRVGAPSNPVPAPTVFLPPPTSTVSGRPPSVTNASAGVAPPGSATAARTSRDVNRGRLNTSTFIALGEGLAAGMGDFSLSDESQKYSFPAQMAQQMGATFDQPLIQPPGVGQAIGFAPWSVIVPSPLQSTVLDQIPPDPPSNLSVPGFSVSDALRLRPRQPLIDRTSPKQTTANLIFGIRGMAYAAPPPLPTQLESAVRRKPTLALVELGYAEALEAAVTGKPDRLPRSSSFREDYSTIVRELRSTGADVIILTVPDPTDTAHFSTLQAASPIVKLDVSLLMELWNLRTDDLITANGLNEISFQLYAASVAPSGGSIKPLPPGSVLAADVAARIQAGIQDLNQEIRQIASAQGAIVYDLYAFIKQVHTNGAPGGGRTLTGDYLGGFYSLNGYYPGATGQALIANEILGLLNKEFNASFPPVNLASVLAVDPVAGYKKAEGPNWTKADLTSAQPLPSPPSAPPSAPPAPSGPPQPPPASGQVIDTTAHVLQLPPGLEQVLPLNPGLSYFGDALSAQNCRTPQTIQWGSGGNLFFNGLAMMDSHLSGNVRIKFTPPVDDWTTFEISFGQGLVGADSVLAAPSFFQMPGKQQRVGDVPGVISSGRLNLRSGQVDPTNGKLNIYTSFFNTALFALLRVNPNFPTTPLSFPGPYGSATVNFDQRPDGKLDFTFFGSTFVPLGNQMSFPLNFSGPTRQFASIPANGTVLHPHISLTTKATQPSTSSSPPEIPFNTVQEFTLFTAVSSFGDFFTLDAPEVGGPALGRSRLLGRVQLQFGPKSGNSVPIAISTAAAGGVLAPLDPTPIAQLFPGRLTPGPQGFYENLRFPFRTYSLNDLAVIDDPFDLSVAALDLRTGQSLQPVLHRGFINQDLIFALLRVEPRTPKDSFFFRGFATLKNGRDHGQLFSYFGAVHIPYPPGFLFPDPNLATGFSVVGGGALDPYLWMWAVSNGGSRTAVQTGKADHAVSSRGEVFSYQFAVSGHPDERPATFQFENHSQQGKFVMHSLAWIDSTKSSLGGESFDLVTFAGFGVWKKADVERVVQASAQFASSPNVSYVGIQIGPGGEISNVNIVSPPTAFPVPSTTSAAVPNTTSQAATTSTKERAPMYSHIIELTAKAGQARTVIDVIRDRAIPEVIRPSEGFVDEIVLLSDADPNHVTAISFWRTKKDADRFFETGFSKVSALTAPFLNAKPDRHEFVVGASTNDHISGWGS